MKDHALFSPSSASRWLACPGSIARSLDAVSPSSPAADEGTWAHAYASALVELKVRDPRKWIGKALQGQDPVTTELGENLLPYFKYVWKVIRHAEFHATEIKVVLNDLCWGTVDFLAYDPYSKALHVVDLKYGAGLYVNAVHNPQLAIYALAALEQYDFDVTYVKAAIVQPRCLNGGKADRYWFITKDVLEDWRWKIFKGIEAALKPDAPLKAGPHCRYCPAASSCPAFAERNRMMLAEVPAPPSETSTPEELAAALDWAENAREWASLVAGVAMRALEAGEKIPGWGLKETRPQRKWISPGTVAQELSKQFNVPVEVLLEPVSPAQAERLVGRNKRAQSVISELTTLDPTGRKQLARTKPKLIEDVSDLIPEKAN